MSKKVFKLNKGISRGYAMGGKGSALSILSSFALIASLSIGMPAHASLEPAYYPSGPQQNVSKQTLTDGGWELCWSGLYGGTDTMQNIFDSCTETYLLYAGGETAADSYLLAAAGERTTVFTETTANQPVENNGSFWYLNYGQQGVASSIGFAPNSTITQFEADTYDSADPLRLSWHTQVGGPCNTSPPATRSICGGYRIGTLSGLNDSSLYERAIWQSSGRPEPVAETPTPEEPEAVQFGGPLAMGATFVRNESGEISEVRISGKRMLTISRATINGVGVQFVSTKNTAVFAIPKDLARGTYDLVLETRSGRVSIARLITIR